MAANYDRLRSERDLYERYWREEKETSKRVNASNIALRAVITRLKNEAKRVAEAAFLVPTEAADGQ